MKQRLMDQLVKLAFQSGGAHKTRADRVNTIHRFVDHLRKENININSVEHVRVVHIEGYIKTRLSQEVSNRTLCNEMASIRAVLISGGRKLLVENDRLTNKSLNISGGSRTGKKVAIPDMLFDEIYNKALDHDEGFAACLALSRYLGLRAEEAVQSAKSLTTWSKHLKQGQNRLTIIYGTKGGRKREATIHNSPKVAQAIQFATTVTKYREGVLINKNNLKSAMNYFSNTSRLLELTGQHSHHSLRYAYAVDGINAYIKQGFTIREALAMVSMDLGHGDGRGRYIKSIYGRSFLSK